MKRRIFFGLAPIFVLIVGMGAYAMVLFAKLGSQVDVVLRENYRSVIAGQQMKESAERMDSALFFSLVGEEQRGRQLYDDFLPKFQDGLSKELLNITLPGEDGLAHSIQTVHAQYAQKVDTFWKTSDLPTRREIYFHDLLPIFTNIKDTAQAIITLNQDNMLKADREARELSARSTRYMAFASILGIAAACFFAARLQKGILQPIQTLTALSKELGDGKLDQVVPVNSNDELGELADAFNKLAGKLRAYRQVTSDQILQARQMTETTFSAFPDPIVALSPAGVIDFANPAAITLFHKIGSDGCLPEDVQRRAESVLIGGLDYLPTSFENLVVVRVDDKEVALLPRIVGMRDEAGAVYGAAVILQDVTRLRLLDEVKTNLVSTVSHELKTPLTSVRMSLYLLLEERIGSLNPKQTELLVAARDDSERLLEMLNDLLDLAKLESGNLQLDRKDIGAAGLVQIVFSELGAFAESHGSKIAVVVDPNLSCVRVDLRQISYAFTNLVTNAVKHSKRGETVTLSARNLNGMIRFSVIDQGPGILPEFQSRIFERFFRVPGEIAGGAGLGLAIAKEIITAHGGHIGLHSKLGEGCEFYFDLPVAPTVS